MSGITVRALAEAIGARAEGDGALVVQRPCHPLQATAKTDLALAMNPSLTALLPRIPVRAAVLSDGADWRNLGLDAVILVNHARTALAALTEHFWRCPDIARGVHPSAAVDPSAMLGEKVSIGPFVEIGPLATVGRGTTVLGSATIGAEASVGEKCLIYPGVRIGGRVQVGSNVVLHSNACIGSDGFSFLPSDPDLVAKAKAGKKLRGVGSAIRRIHSLGTVRIGDHVEIGSNSAVDRATIEETQIGEGTKIDNLVHVAHNVRIGKHCLICGQVGIAGSAVIGDRCILGGQVGVGEHVKIGDNCLIGGKSLVGRKVRPGSILVGWASLERDEFHAVFRAIRRLPRER